MCVGPYEGKLRVLSPDSDPWFGGGASLTSLTVGERHREAYWERSGIKALSREFLMALPALVERGQVLGVEGERLVEVEGPAGHRVWLAERYGYQPLRREWRCVVGGHVLAVDEFWDYRRVTEELWLPYRMRRRYEGEWYGLGGDVEVEYEVEEALGRVPEEGELREVFFGEVPDERCLVVDSRWFEDPRTGRPVSVKYPWVRDEGERERLRREAVARMRAMFEAYRRGRRGMRWWGWFAGTGVALALAAIVVLWQRKRRRAARQVPE